MEEQRQPERRDKARPVKVYLTPAERADIEIKAAATGLPIAVFLRRVGLGAAVPSILDHKAVLALLKVNADQGRLGGLLKLWLWAEKPAPRLPPKFAACSSTSKAPKKLCAAFSIAFSDNRQMHALYSAPTRAARSPRS